MVKSLYIYIYIYIIKRHLSDLVSYTVVRKYIYIYI